jgi:cytoskeleton protein RodZ
MAGTEHRSVESPGQRLRAARQELAWNVDEVAEELRLSPELIRALEADRYEGMPGRTYVLGYIRSYARLLDIDIEDSIADHRSRIPDPPAEARFAAIVAPEPEPAEEGPRPSSRIVVATLVAVLAVAALLLWQLPGRDDGGQAAAPDSTPADTGSDTLVVDSAPEPEQPAPGTTGQDEPAAVGVPSEPANTGPVDVPSANVASAGAGAAADEPATAGTDPPAFDLRWRTGIGVMNGTFVPVNGSGPASSAAAEAGSPVPAEARRHLLLHFREGSWADVSDNTGRNLLSRTVEAGTRLDLEGEPPFTLFLGNAGGVQIVYLGKVMDLAAPQLGMFARFVVGDDGKPGADSATLPPKPSAGSTPTPGKTSTQ